ncbi:hypothetical protein BD769DRAFT_903081 [Suillus cothurnatus]|nr:hypothetical protein BD769DRAFT_903081 [Suillus cothurnatus]
MRRHIALSVITPLCLTYRTSASCMTFHVRFTDVDVPCFLLTQHEVENAGDRCRIPMQLIHPANQVPEKSTQFRHLRMTLVFKFWMRMCVTPFHFYALVF